METTSTNAGVSRDFLSILSCPYCGFKLDIESASACFNAPTIRSGILRCACHEYPIVDGIPILQQIDGLEQVVQRVRGEDPAGALLRALDLFRVQWAHRSRFHRLKYYWNCRKLASRSGISFCDAAHLVRSPRVFADYLVHRYANPSFLAAIGPLMLLGSVAKGLPPAPARGVVPSVGFGNATARVLDLGCGAGHASYLMRLLYPGLSVVSADQDFVNVYLARRYMVPDGFHLCIDAQVPSPFPERYFDAIYCQDAFHYVRSKKAAINELKRVSIGESLWIFPHLHNRLCHNLVAGQPLSPQGYLECFDLPDARVFAEGEMLRQLTQNGVMDLTDTSSLPTLDKAPVLTLIKGGAGVWRSHRGFPGAFRGDPHALQVNPIYHCRRQGGGMDLELRWPNPVMARECSEATTVLPQKYHLTDSQLSRLGVEAEDSDTPWLDELLMKFVLVPLPSRYLGNSRGGGDPQL